MAKQKINDTIFKELVKRGHSNKKGMRVWDISDSKLWYLTPELSKGFLKLIRPNPYRINVVEREIELIKDHSGDALKFFGKNKFNIIDLGSGTGVKAEVFIKSLPKGVKARYFPVDISKYYIDLSVDRMKNLNSSKVMSVKPFVSDFRDVDEIIGMMRTDQFQNNIVLLLGETLSHYDINDLLYKISNSMFKGDVLVIGNGIRTGKRFVDIQKYKVPLFNEWFIHIMEGLGFREDEIEYNARFANKRLEAYYTVKVDKVIEHKGKKVHFKGGDEVIIGVQYKYYAPELEKFCKMYFCDAVLFMDGKKEYSLTMCKK